MKLLKLVAVLLFFKTGIIYSQCDVFIKKFEDDLYSSKQLREYVAKMKQPDNAFDAWRILYQEDLDLTKDLAKIKEVERNLEAIKKIGGYKKWQSLSDFFKNNQWTNTNIDLFLNTFSGAKSLENAQSWKLLKDAGRTKLMNDTETVQKLAEVLSDRSIQKILGNETDNILKKFLTVHKNDNWSWNKFALKEHLDKLKTITNRYEGVEGFNKSLRDALNNPAPAVQDGLWHMITDLEKRNIAKTKIKAFDLEFDGDDLPCINCRFDVELITQNTDELKFIEYKSYKNAENINKKQFLNYIAKIDDIKQLQYVFNKNKLSLNEAKNGMKEFFKKNVEDMFKPIRQEGIGKDKMKKLFEFDNFKFDNATEFKQLLDKNEKFRNNVLKFIIIN